MSELGPTAIRLLAAMLEERTGQQLAPARRWRMELALKPLMQARGLATLDAVAALAAGGRDPQLADTVIDALLNNETSFFRDAAAFGALIEVALPQLRAGRPEGRRLRVWCAGCSTGQEAYSLAMAFAADARLGAAGVDIIATDISRSAIARARGGVYPQIEVQRGLPVRLMLEWFHERRDGAWEAAPALRTRTNFQVRNLLDPPPLLGLFDVVLCRNVLLYFDAPRRTRVFDRLADALMPDGVLMLGAGETVIGQTARFAADPALRGFYRPVADVAAPSLRAAGGS